MNPRNLKPSAAHASRQFRGMLAVYKPKGMISKDVSRWIERRIGRQKLGHVGTLDPLAEGVLCLLFGSATRLQDHLLDMPKSYEFDMKLGMETDSLDLDGNIIKETDASKITREDIAGVLDRFRGSIKQVPPAYSAVKYKGKPLYEYARKDKASEVPVGDLERSVTIESLELTGFEAGIATLKTRCSKGTYVRSLMRDIAHAAGTVATLGRLIRTEASGCDLGDCVTLETLEAAITEGPDAFERLVLPPENLALGLPVWQSVSHDCQTRLRNGQKVSVDAATWLANFKHSGVPDYSGESRMMPVELLLLDEHGHAFGLGESRMGEGGRFLITMKRGLS